LEEQPLSQALSEKISYRREIPPERNTTGENYHRREILREKTTTGEKYYGE
jgi:hypothetical protein